MTIDSATRLTINGSSWTLLFHYYMHVGFPLRSEKKLYVNNSSYRKSRLELTCYSEGGISARDAANLILGDAPVNTAILLLLSVHHPQEEERSRRKQNSMRFGISWRCWNGFTILVPFYHRLRFTLCFTVQSYWLVFRHYYIWRMFRYPWGSLLCWNKKINPQSDDVYRRYRWKNSTTLKVRFFET